MSKSFHPIITTPTALELFSTTLWDQSQWVVADINRSIGDDWQQVDIYTEAHKQRVSVLTTLHFPDRFTIVEMSPGADRHPHSIQFQCIKVKDAK